MRHPLRFVAARRTDQAAPGQHPLWVAVRHAGHSLAAVAMFAAIVSVGAQLGASVSAHSPTPPASSPAQTLAAQRDLQAELAAYDRQQSELATYRHLAAERASRAARARREALRPKWARPSYLPFTSPFGPRWGGFHPGIDFSGPIGAPVFAAGDGWIVTPIGTEGYGNVIAIAHPDGSTTWYCHLSQILVTSGHVLAGQTIGLVGNTGWVTGPHLHFEVRYNNVPVDPVPWLRGHGIQV